MRLEIDIDGRRFVPTSNEHGVASTDTVFEYHVDGTVVTGSYRGGRIAAGSLVGRVTGAHSISMLYQCVTTEGELMAGSSSGIVSRDDEERVRLSFEWAWLTGDRSGGESRYVELT